MGACGGATRADTVAGALADSGAADDAWVLVHDAARPGLPAEALARLIDACLKDPVGGLLALPVADTVKGGHERVERTLDRNGLWLAQTPQMFRAGAARRPDGGGGGGRGGDRRGVGHRGRGLCAQAGAGLPAQFQGDLAGRFRTDGKMVMSIPFRVGQGFDVHALVEGRPSSSAA